MSDDYENVLNNVQHLYRDDKGVKYLRILSVITELMMQTLDDRLSGAVYCNEFNVERLKIRVMVEKK